MMKSRVRNGQCVAHARIAVAIAALFLWGAPARAAFHIVVIDEVLTSYDSNTEVQFVEMRMLAGLQVFVTNSVFAAFDANGSYVSDILVVPGPNLASQGNGVRWLIGTEAFRERSGLAPDYIMPAGLLPSGGGMLCFGGGGGISPQNPPNWVRTNFSNYVDCVAYGTYTGPTNVRIGDPTTLNGDGHSLQRGANTRNNLNDFTCAETITPQNNAGTTVELPSTASCLGAETPTETPTAGETATTTPTPTATGGESATVTPTATLGPPIACVADCDENGIVSLPEVIRAVNIALTNAALDTCEQADADGDGFPGIDELVRAVTSSVRGCD